MSFLNFFAERLRYAVLLIFVGAYGQQQEPSLTQYMYNIGLFNPAYTTNLQGITKGGVLFSKSLLGLKGTPYTATAFVHYGISRNVEGGINLIHDSIGEDLITKTAVNADVGYTIDVSKSLKLSFGLKYGFNFHKINGDRINSSGRDYVFYNDSNTFQQLGFGVFLFSEDFFAGLSVSDVLLDRTPEFKEVSNFYGIGGYVFHIDKRWIIKPMVMVSMPQNGNPIISFNALADYEGVVEFGLAYRSSTLGGLVNFRVHKSFRFTYSYAHLFNGLGSSSYGTHQLGFIIDVRNWRQTQRVLF